MSGRRLGSIQLAFVQIAFRGGALLALLFSFCAVAGAQWNALNPVADMQKQADGILLKMERGTLRITACSDSIVRVTYAPGDSLPDRPTLTQCVQDNLICKVAGPRLDCANTRNMA